MSEIVEVVVSHPLEDAFDIEPCTTVAERRVAEEIELVSAQGYDDKDNEIESNLQDVYTAAMTMFEDVAEEMESVEGKYKARITETAAQMLNVALSAVKEKRHMKEHKDKLSVSAIAAGTPGTLNQNVIVADRNDILRALMDKSGDSNEDG